MKRTVEVTISVDVTVDEEKLNKGFIDDFQLYMYPFKTIEDHIKHIAECKVDGIISDNSIEGYGDLNDMGIVASMTGGKSEIVHNHD